MLILDIHCVFNSLNILISLRSFIADILIINEAGKAAKQATNMPGMITVTLLHMDHLTIRKARNSDWHMEWENNTGKLQLYTIQGQTE